MENKKEADYLEVYRYDTICSNCGRQGSALIPKGVTLDVYYKDASCSNCGCKLKVK